MTAQTKTILQTTLAGGVLVAAVAFGVARWRAASRVGEEGLRVFFYDESEQRLYAVPRETLAPHVGVGGARDDGVRAVVVAAESEQHDPSQQRIAYLEKYTPELKGFLEERRAARAAGRPPRQPMPSSEGEFFDVNTLVRRPGEDIWYDLTQPEARRITLEWHQWRSADGRALVVCVP